MIHDLEQTKCVLIVDNSLTIGEQANVAAVLAMTIGAKNSEIIGANVSTLDNISHQGITQLNLPVLTASEEILRKIHEQSRVNDKVFLVDFTSTAQMARTYDEFSTKMSSLAEKDLKYIGIGIIGDKKIINKYSGNLKLLR